MTRSQLEHAIRAACDISGDNEIIVFGSQAILGTYPDAPETLTASIEVDVQPRNHPENTDLIDGNLGEMSLFHETHGFYIHGITIDSAKLPHGWEKRTIPVSDQNTTRGNTGYCLEVHDLAASKLFANREKDRIFVATLLLEKLVDKDMLIKRISALEVDNPGITARMIDWINSTTAEIES